MTKSPLNKTIITLFTLIMALAGCTPMIRNVQGMLIPTKTYDVFMAHPQVATPVVQIPSPTVSPTATATPEPSATPSPSATPTETPTSTFPPTELSPTWVWTDPGRVIVPILLYHHVSDDHGMNRYFVTPENFRGQMRALKRWGYTSITPSTLVQVLTQGGDLPARPVIITFDDGNLDVYSNAFPIMKKLGFVGTFYIVAEKLAEYNLVNAEQLSEMIAAGWEIGSHSLSHNDLTYNHASLNQEILQSRLLLEDILGVPVRSLAYPFGLADDYVKEWTQEYGYTSGMGLGTFNDHTPNSLYFLSRREVRFEFDMDAFKALLPWTEPPDSP